MIGVLGGGTATLYINGVNVGSRTLTSVAHTHNQPWLIGAFIGSIPSFPFYHPNIKNQTTTRTFVSMVSSPKSDFGTLLEPQPRFRTSGKQQFQPTRQVWLLTGQ